jgi:geranyl-CoA carboxylase beta subunit
MSAYASRVNVTSESYAANRKDMLALIDRLNALNGRAVAASERRKPRFDERGQLTPRERLARLLDPGMPFLEIGNMAGYLGDTDDPEKTVPGGSNICGIGFVSGVRVVVTVDDSGINAGAITKGGGGRFRRCQRIAQQQKLPFIHLVESAGANLLNYRVEGWVEGGRLFGNLALLSAAGIPTFTVLHGASTAGGAYMPGLSDYVVAVKGRGKAFLAGPALLKAATGEIASEADLGGAEMHASVSGLAEYLAEDDGDALAIARALVSRLDWNANCPSHPPRQIRRPVYAADEIAGIVPVDYRKPYDVREVWARIVDGSEILDFKPDYGVATICANAEVFGQACGLIGNNGPIDTDGATKAAQFIQLCDQAQIPLVFFQNITGYMVGTDHERAGMIKHGSKMIQAVQNARVTRITFMIGASFGAGNYGMCGQGYDPDFVFGWPNALSGVMGGEQAAKTMTQVMEAAAERKGVDVDRAALEAQEKRLIHHFDSQSDAFYTSGLLLDDGLIDPRDTRKVLGFALETCWEARNRQVSPNSFGVARM